MPGWLIGTQSLSWTCPIVIEDSLSITCHDPIQSGIVLVVQKSRRKYLQILGDPLFETFGWSNTINYMGANAKFFRLPVKSQLPPGFSNLVMDYCRSTTSRLIFEANISGTKFRKPRSNRVLINTIVTINAWLIFRTVSTALWLNLNL